MNLKEQLISLGFDEAEAIKASELAKFETPGIYIVSGATATGKTSTLKLILESIIASNGSTVITVEDPPEYLIQGATAIDVDSSIERNGFSAAINKAMHMDVSVIMLGSLHNNDTAHAAIQAAQSGCLIWTTVIPGRNFSESDTHDYLTQFGISKDLIRGVILQPNIRQ